MSGYDFSAPRLFVDAPLEPGGSVTLEAEAHNYLRNVMRLGPGGSVLAFNGRQGEWRGEIADAGRKRTVLMLREQTRPQSASSDLWYLFAPLKHARLDYMVQKAVEMGVSRLMPVMTRRTQASRLNTERMRANAVEAAEQCGILSLPDIVEPTTLERALSEWPDGRHLVFCDEDAAVDDALTALRPLAGVPLAVIVGPEGGFDPAERARLMKLPHITRISLGPRVLRADTAAVAALALIQAVAGDWKCL